MVVRLSALRTGCLYPQEILLVRLDYISYWVRGLSAPMNLGLNRQALCAPYQIMGAVAPRHKILITSGSKKGTQIHFFFFSQMSSPNRFASGAPMERFLSTGHLHISKRPNKISSNKKALRKKRPSMFPKSGAPVEIDAHF